MIFLRLRSLSLHVEPVCFPLLATPTIAPPVSPMIMYLKRYLRT